jgi:two-component system sensor histidine kinase PilS (NtrC family)
MEFSRRLQKLMFLRVLFASLLLGVSILTQIGETKTYFGGIRTAHYLLIATIYCLTFLYLLLLKYSRRYTLLAYGQLLVDTILVTFIIYTTGGRESIFSFLYILTIINASILLYRKGGIVVATSSSFLYSLLLVLHYSGTIHPFGSLISEGADQGGRGIYFTISVNVAAFFLVAILSSFLAEQVRNSQLELKARQDDLVKLEALNERIIKSITSGLMTLDGDGKILLFNPAAEKIFSVEAKHVVGKKVLDVLPGLQGVDNLRPALTQVPSRHDSFIDFPLVNDDGNKVYLRLSRSPLLFEGGSAKGHILIFQDLTSIKEIEEEMKKREGLALIGELAAGVAHEIRNPLASISGSIQMLKENLDEDNVNSRLMDITLREIARLNHLVEDFLVFARPKEANHTSFDLGQLITDTLLLFKKSDRWTANIEIATHFDTPIQLYSDPDQLKQVLWNLFLNASEAMEKGGRLLVSTTPTNSIGPPVDRGHRGAAVEIIVRDSGQGFTEEALDHLFSPFYTSKRGGSGLGLAIVKRIVEGLQGGVYGKNHPDGGAEIKIVLPLHPEHPMSEGTKA